VWSQCGLGAVSPDGWHSTEDKVIPVTDSDMFAAHSSSIRVHHISGACHMFRDERLQSSMVASVCSWSSKVLVALDSTAKL